MISPKELRIGNIIKIKDNEIIVASINEKGAAPKGIDIVDIRHFEGIPITKEWLLKFGFVMYCGSYKKENVKIFDDSPEFHYEGRYGMSVGRLFLYVHQLQNIYFCLTGEELEIK